MEIKGSEQNMSIYHIYVYIYNIAFGLEKSVEKWVKDNNKYLF